MKRILAIAAAVFCFAAVPVTVFAQQAANEKPAAYAGFTKDLTAQRGLFTIWRKPGKVYIELAKSQLDTDFIQTAEPASGLGGYGVTQGLPYLQFARIMRFTPTADGKIAIIWPNTSFVANTPAGTNAIRTSFANSVLAVQPIVARDDATGTVLIDASPFLGDVIDMTDALRFATNTDKNPMGAYRLDSERSYFGETKAFPENIMLEADQTFASASPLSPDGSVTLDNVPDPRTVQIKVKYNIVQAPPSGSYMPRIADDRVGYYPNILLDYSKDRVQERQLRYILRWNIKRHPMVYYISDTVPAQYRPWVREALLKWNAAFERIGIHNAVQVRNQSDDPNFDIDDVRYVSVHWLTQSNSGGYAQAGAVYDPRTGELIKTSVVIDADLMYFGNLEGEDLTGPVAGEMAYERQAHENALFGLWSLRAAGGASWRYIPPDYAKDFLEWIVLHESGHGWGLQHNFIASQAYSAKELQSKAFTSRYGLANSVMEYTPTNVWPKGTPKGDYFQLALGPYDYYAIHWGYAPVPGAKTAQDEVPTLQRWASKWSDPRYRFANDEDNEWRNGHAIDPRVDTFDLSNDNLAWCDAQMKVGSQLLGSLESRYREYEETHDAERTAFDMALSPFRNCSVIASHYIGGETLSRAHIGDPGASLPIGPVSRADAQRAFAMLDRDLLANTAWNFSPHLLRELVYTEWVTDFPQQPWQYNPPLRHDEPVASIVLGMQQRTIAQMMQPAVLQRIDDFSLKYKRGTTMSLVDLFDWTHRAVFADLTSAGEIHRNLQQWYARRLVDMVKKPQGIPYDAQSLARADLVTLRAGVNKARKTRGLDAMTRAHLDALAAVTK